VVPVEEQGRLVWVKKKTSRATTLQNQYTMTRQKPCHFAKGVIFWAYRLQSPNHPFNLAQGQERSKRARKPNLQVGDARRHSRAAKEMLDRSTEIE